MENIPKDEASGSSASFRDVEKSTYHQHALPNEGAPKDVQETEANALPDTSDEKDELDLEKAENASKAAKPPGQMDLSSFPDGG